MQSMLGNEVDDLFIVIIIINIIIIMNLFHQQANSTRSK